MPRKAERTEGDPNPASLPLPAEAFPNCFAVRVADKSMSPVHRCGEYLIVRGMKPGDWKIGMLAYAELGDGKSHVGTIAFIDGEPCLLPVSDGAIVYPGDHGGIKRAGRVVGKYVPLVKRFGKDE